MRAICVRPRCVRPSCLVCSRRHHRVGSANPKDRPVRSFRRVVAQPLRALARPRRGAATATTLLPRRPAMTTRASRRPAATPRCPGAGRSRRPPARRKRQPSPVIPAAAGNQGLRPERAVCPVCPPACVYGQRGPGAQSHWPGSRQTFPGSRIGQVGQAHGSSHVDTVLTSH